MGVPEGKTSEPASLGTICILLSKCLRNSELNLWSTLFSLPIQNPATCLLSNPKSTNLISSFSPLSLSLFLGDLLWASSGFIQQQTRKSDNISIPSEFYAKISRSCKSFSYREAQLWNDLRVDVKKRAKVKPFQSCT